MLKAAVVILAIGTIYAGIYSVMTLAAPRMMEQSTFEAITGKALDSVQDAGYLKALLHEMRSVGLYALTAVIFSFFILFAGFRKAQRWAWWAFLIGGGLAWLWGLIDGIAIGNRLHIPLQAIGIVLFLVGMLIPIKAFFGKEAEEETQDAEGTEEG
jgi:hypothetical protein